jgi:hypothetical protein
VDTGFLVVVAFNLCFLSGLIAYRMRASGAATGQIALPVIELWVACILWIAIFASISETLGRPESGSAAGEARQFGTRLAELSAPAKGWLAVGAGSAVAILLHLLWTMGKVMRGEVGSSKGSDDGGVS